MVLSENVRDTDAEHGARAKVLFICGSLNQTSQLHAVARAMNGIDARYTPFYASKTLSMLRRFGLLENTIGGEKLRGRCLRYLEHHELRVDLDGAAGKYDLVVSCTDVALPHNLGSSPLVVVQEGLLDPPGLAMPLVCRFPGIFPRWLAGTACTGLSGAYFRFCAASAGYRELIIARGALADRVVVTGIPNFDDCASFMSNDFPRRDYALVCTSDARETFKRHDRRAFIARAIRLGAGWPLLFKLHPNENVARAVREIERWAPGATIYVDGPTHSMIANCALLITEWSSVAFVGLALGKRVYSSHPREMLERLIPEQNRSAARRIAAVCEETLARRSGAEQGRSSRVAA